MTVSNSTRQSGPYNGNGVTTVFDYDYLIFDDEHLRVVQTVAGFATTLDIGVDYTVSGVGLSDGGSVTMAVAPVTGATIMIYGDAPFTQETDLENQGAYYAETVERALDLGVIRDLELKRDVESWNGRFDDVDNAVASTAADKIATAADRVATGSDRVATAADRVQTGLDLVATGADVVSTAADAVSTAADAASTAVNTQIAVDSANTAANTAGSVSAALLPALSTYGNPGMLHHWADKNGKTLAYIDAIGRMVVQDIYVEHSITGLGAPVPEDWRGKSSITVGTGYIEFDISHELPIVKGDQAWVSFPTSSLTALTGRVVWYQHGMIGLWIDQAAGSGTFAADAFVLRTAAPSKQLEGIVPPTSDLGSEGQKYLDRATGSRWERISVGWICIQSGPVIPPGAIVVSSLSFGGTGTGNDTTGAGTQAAPYLTLTKALTIATAGQLIVLNGSPLAPTEYEGSGSYTDTTGVSIDSSVPYGAKITSTGGTVVFNADLTTGETCRLGRVIVDGETATSDCIRVPDTATAGTLILDGTRVENFNLRGVYGTGTATRVNLKVFGASITSSVATCTDGIYIPALDAGDSVVLEADIRLTNQSTSNRGPITVAATVGTSASFKVYGGRCWSNLLSSLTLTGRHHAIKLTDITASDVRGVDAEVIGEYGDRSAAVIYITAGLKDSPNARIVGNVMRNGTKGGYALELGEEDFADPATDKLNNFEAYCNYATGVGATMQSAAGALHAFFIASGAIGEVFRNKSERTGYGGLCKYTAGVNFYSNVWDEYYNSGMVDKGSTDTIFQFNTVIQRERASFFQFSAYPEVPANATDWDMYGNDFVGACADSLISEVQASQTTGTIGYNNYSILGEGSFWDDGSSAGRWQWGSTYYKTFAAWKAAIEGTATSADPGFRDFDNRDYRIGAPTAKRGTVPYRASAPVDFYGRARNPAGTTCGAFEAA